MGFRGAVPDAAEADAPQRAHDLREVFNGMRWIVRTGSPWRYLPNDLPPWEAVYQQGQRRWVVERSFAWLTRFRRLAKDYERLASTLKGMQLAAFAIVMLARVAIWNGITRSIPDNDLPRGHRRRSHGRRGSSPVR